MILLVLLLAQVHRQFLSFEEFKKMDSFDTQNEYHGDLKDRYNYASSQCAASVLKVNKEVKGGSRILNDNRDSYMLTPCNIRDKFIIIELCEDILIDTLVMGNFEYFSSTFKRFKISIAQRYPPTQGWVGLSEFTAVNSKRKQVFRITNPLLWARFVKIDFIDFFDNQYYCPLSLVQIYGTSMIEEYKRFVDDTITIPPLSLPSGSNNSAHSHPQQNEEDSFLLDGPDITNLNEEHAVFVEEWLNYCKSKDFEYYFSNQCFSTKDAYKQEFRWDLLTNKLPQSVYTSIISGLNHLERNHIKLIQHVHGNNLKISDKFNKIDTRIAALEKSIFGLNMTLYDEIAKLRISFDLFEKRQKKVNQRKQVDLKQEIEDLKFKLERIFEETLENRKWDRLRTILIILILMIVLAKNTSLSKYATTAFFYYSPSSSPTKDMSIESQSMPSSPLLRKRMSE